MTDSPAELLPLKDVSARFGVGYTALWEAVRNGDLPAEKFRGRWRVDPTEVVAWMRADDSHRTNRTA